MRVYTIYTLVEVEHEVFLGTISDGLVAQHGLIDEVMAGATDHPLGDVKSIVTACDDEYLDDLDPETFMSEITIGQHTIMFPGAVKEVGENGQEDGGGEGEGGPADEATP